MVSLKKTRQGKTVDTVENTEKNKEGNIYHSITEGMQQVFNKYL